MKRQIRYIIGILLSAWVMVLFYSCGVVDALGGGFAKTESAAPSRTMAEVDMEKQAIAEDVEVRTGAASTFSFYREEKRKRVYSGYAEVLVDNVEKTAEAVFARGGSAVGELVVREIPGVGIITVQYVTDPEGNIVEIQKWEKIQGS